MLFPGVGPVPVRWYWTEKDFLKFPTVYNSLNEIKTDSSDWDADDGLAGEMWTAPRRWRNGSSPLMVNGPSPRGSRDAWLGLSDSSSPLFGCGTWPAEYDDEYDDQFMSETFVNE